MPKALATSWVIGERNAAPMSFWIDSGSLYLGMIFQDVKTCGEGTWSSQAPSACATLPQFSMCSPTWELSQSHFELSLQPFSPPLRCGEGDGAESSNPPITQLVPLANSPHPYGSPNITLLSH